MKQLSPGIYKGQLLPLCCLVDMVDLFPDPPRKCVFFVMVSFVTLLVEDEEQLLVLVLALGFSQADLEDPDQTKRAILRHARSKVRDI